MKRTKAELRAEAKALIAPAVELIEQVLIKQMVAVLEVLEESIKPVPIIKRNKGG